MTRTRLALAAALLAAAAPAAAQTPSFTVFDLSLPLRVGGYERVDLKYEQGSYMARYQAEGGRYVDAIFYPFGVEAACGGACDSLAVDRQSDGFAEAIPMLLERGYYERLAVAGDRRVRQEGGAMRWRGRHLALRGAREGGEVSSQFYLMSQGVHLLKVRATYAPDSAEDARVDSFVAGMVAAMGELNAGCGGGAEWNGDAFAITADIPRPPAEVAEHAAAVLTSQGFTVIPTPDPLTVVTAPRWIPAAELAAMEDRTNPGMRVAVMVREKEGRAAVEVGAQVVCRIPGADDAKHTAMELVAATALEMELSGEKPEGT